MKFKDISDTDEDKRVEIIGKRVTTEHKTVGFITDEEEGKADRYIKKLQERFPSIVVLARGKGPVKGTVWVKVGERQ